MRRWRERLPFRGRADATDSYFLCGTPRTGTTLLAGLLEGTGLVGRAGEFFAPKEEPGWAAADYRRFVEDVMARTSRNGMFGCKLLHSQHLHLLARLRTLPESSALDDRSLLEAVFPAPRFLWIRRHDTVAQAVSWWKARQTGVWYDTDPRRNGQPPEYDFAHIRRLTGEIEAANERWVGWFEAHGIEPLPLVYEELIADIEGTTREVLDYVGRPADASVRIVARTTRQFDATNADWIRRFLDEAGSAVG